MDIFTLHFVTALLGILWVDLLLSGDNALVIAMATRRLDPKRQAIARWGGTAVAVILRIVGAAFAGALMAVPGLAVLGGVLLLGIAYKLIAAEDDEPNVAVKATLAGAVTTIAVADASMSLDNVIAVAGLSHGDNLLMAIGIILSIPMVVAGSVAISWLLKRLPVLVWAGAAILGYVAGGIITHDPGLPAVIWGLSTVVAYVVWAPFAIAAFTTGAAIPDAPMVEMLPTGAYVTWILLAPLLGAVLVVVTGAAARLCRRIDRFEAQAV